MKKGKIILRESSDVSKAQYVFNKAQLIIKDLDNGTWGREKNCKNKIGWKE